MRVLVIEDHPLVGQTFAAAVELAGFEPEFVTSGEAALAAYQARPADIVVTDIFMPGIDGLEVIQALRRLQPLLPIIAITGGPKSMELGAIDYLEFARIFGARHTLTKPVRVAALIAALQECREAAMALRG